MIRGYPERTTVAPGGEVVLRVSTDASRFRVDFYRVGAEAALVSRSEWQDGCQRPDHLPFHDWGRDNEGLHGEPLPAWEAYSFTVGRAWPPGVYVAVLVEEARRRRPQEAPPNIDARDARALFVVRDDSREPARILYKIPLFTYHAYNRVSSRGYDAIARRGNWSLYTLPDPADLPAPVPPSVSLRRPGGGTGGCPSDTWNFDPFDPTPRQTFVHWDARFVAWLERSGYSVDYCTDVEVHEDAELALLSRYPVLVSAGHDEYWSDEMRDHVEGAIREGMNAAFFGANTSWWRIEFDDHCSFRRVTHWSDPAGLCRPENAMTGVSFRNGGERDLDRYPFPVGYRVQHADHWVFDGVGVGDGDTFGDRAGEYLVGYECDGAHFDRVEYGRRGVATPTGDDGTPAEFTILGVGDVAVSGWGLGNRAATMGVIERPGGATVFTAATTDWPRFLAADPHPVVDRITHNVLDRLAR